MTSWAYWTSKCFHILWIITSAVLPVQGIESLNERLIRDLYKTYQRDVRPICGGYPSPVPATLGIAMRQLVDVNEPEQKLASSIWFRMSWQDCRLVWDPADYDNITRVTVPKLRVWVPDLTLYDNAESELGEQDEYLVSFTHEGRVIYNLPAVVLSMCRLDVSMFPFDRQKCYLTLGSWMYRADELELTSSGPNASDMTSYIPHGEWDLYKMDVNVYNTSGVYGSAYSQVVFTIYLKRRPLFHTIILILPSVLVITLAVVGFLLPPECGEKLNLEITMLLSLLVFQVVIINTMPHSSEHIPLLAIYFLVSMIIIACSCLSTVVILNVHYSKHHGPLPDWVRAILRGRFGHLFGVDDQAVNAHEKYDLATKTEPFKNPHQPRLSPKSRKHSASAMSLRSARSAPMAYINGGLTRGSPFTCRSRKQSHDDDSIYGFYPHHGRESYLGHREPPVGVYMESGTPGQQSVSSSMYYSMNTFDHLAGRSDPQAGDSASVAVARKILGHLESITDHHAQKRTYAMLEAEWKIFAVFLDRCLLFLFLLLGLIVTTTFFISMAT